MARSAWWWVAGLVYATGCGGDPVASPDVVEDVTPGGDQADGDAGTEIEPQDTATPTEVDAAEDSDTAVDVEVAPPPPAVTLNEFECRAEWVEIASRSDELIDLDGLVLTDDPDGDNALPLTGRLAPGERLVVDLAGFSLACGSEGPALQWRGAILEAAPPGNAPAGYTFGRFPDTRGEWVVTEPTRGEPNRLPSIDPFDPASVWFGAMRPVTTIALTLPEDTVRSLFESPYTWVPGQFSWQEPGGPASAPQDVALRVKGRIGSYRDLNGKTAFKLDFARFSESGEVRGLERMTLNNMVQDYHRVNEVLGYDLFARMGVPTPRAAYVWLVVNGQDFGLYLHLEAYDTRWRARHFASTLGMFEGDYGADLFEGAAFGFDLDGGSSTAFMALDRFIDALHAAPEDGFMAALAPMVDWDEVLAMLATEIFIGHWDGYGPTRNNFFLHFDADGVLRMVPWGLDQTFAAGLSLYEGQGLILQKCMRDPACRTAFEDKLMALANIVRSPGYLGWADALAEHLQPFIDAEPREDGGEARAGLDNAWEFLRRRAEMVELSVGCRRDPLADVDGDGFVCEEDCDEGDGSRHRGADDLCGDGIDQDCNGRADDGPECPDCAPVTLGGFGDYWFCYRERTFADAEAECARLGARLVVLNSNAEMFAMLGRLGDFQMGSTWIGLTDRDVEGEFRWVDGTPWDGSVGGFLDGQPDNWQGGEDCVHAYPWGGERPWNDLFCDWTQPAVCERP